MLIKGYVLLVCSPNAIFYCFRNTGSQMYNGVSGFDNKSVLPCCPYGGCAILRHYSLCINVEPISVDPGCPGKKPLNE